MKICFATWSQAEFGRECRVCTYRMGNLVDLPLTSKSEHYRTKQRTMECWMQGMLWNETNILKNIDLSFHKISYKLSLQEVHSSIVISKKFLFNF